MHEIRSCALVSSGQSVVKCNKCVPYMSLNKVVIAQESMRHCRAGSRRLCDSHGSGGSIRDQLPQQ